MKNLFILLFAVALAGCQTAPIASETVSVAGGSYQNIAPAGLQSMLQDKDFVLINVHIPFAGDIPGTDLSIPYNDIEANLAQFPDDLSAKIVLYCRSGRMSEIAAEELVARGYTSVWNLQGGMAEWEQAGFALEMDGQ